MQCTYTRIDFILVSNSLISTVFSADIGLRSLSDHAWVSCLLSRKVSDGKGPDWTLNKSLLRDTIICEQIEEEIKNYFSLNSNYGVSKEIVWDAFKTVVRGLFMSATASRKKAKQQILTDLNSNIAFLEARHGRYRGVKTLRKLELERKKLALYDTSYSQCSFFFFLKHKYTSCLPRFLRWLKWKAAKSSSSKFITSLRKNDNSIVFQSHQILKEFTDFYRNLYSSGNPPSQAISSYLDSTNFSVQLSSVNRNFLDSLITSTQILAAIQNLKPNKEPGRDGLPAEFYKWFKDLLMEPLTDLGTGLYSDRVMPKSWAETHIIVIPKKDCDPANFESYRPISLINHDMKIFTSIMARRLNSFIAAYVHYSLQTNF